MKVLIACEYSGKVRDAFSELGNDAWSADLLPTESPGNHYQGDVMDILDNDWDLMIAHPPCTYLANSGVRWLYEQDGRLQKMHEAADFFMALQKAHIPKIAIENPIMHKYAKATGIGQQSQLIQPYNFGHTESKATCLWLKGLPPLISTTQYAGVPDQSIHRMPPGPERSKKRSETFQGIANAMANQWGNNGS